MKHLTGGSEYQSLARANVPDGSAHSDANPFADELNDSSSANSRSSRSNSFSSSSGHVANPHPATFLAVPGASVTPSMSGSDLDRYPLRRSLQNPVPDSSHDLNASVARYSQYDASSHRTSVSSSIQDENDPFLINADSSPFGGFPASEFPLHMDEKEADDYLHNPDPIADAAEDRKCHKLDRRGWGCLVAFVALVLGFIAVFVVLPVLDFTGPAASVSAPNDGVRLSPYTYSHLTGLRTKDGLIDADTPTSAYNLTSINGDTWTLVFSDEFNVDGRTFYPGDDPVWYAPDFHYQATSDLEWYDPDAAYTEGGLLKLRLDAFENHGLFYRSGMLHSWNRLCFTQGHIQVGARLPGNGTVPGLWPGLWTLGNLARPGYLATSDGVWPYGYNQCDAGITPNQSTPDGLSYLPGQRLSKCVCNADKSMHPNPGVGRGAPEIDILEATTASGYIVASQSLQVAPMDIWWLVDYRFVEIYDANITQMNSWTGGPIQQAVSGTTKLNAAWHQNSEERAFQTYAFEYLNNDDDGYITWFVGENPVWSVRAGALSPNGNIGWRQISKEPMSIVMNLGFSTSWTYISWPDLIFPFVFEIDFVRIYQPPNNVSVTCDPPDFPTYEYIQAHPKAYENVNATSWQEAGYSWPRNSLAWDC